MRFQIETERLILRDVSEEDLPILLEQSLETESLKNVLSSQRSEESNRRELENALAWTKVPDRLYYSLSVLLKSDQTLIGKCSINNVSPKSYETSIGWHYGYKYRSNGYATEAARELLNIGFELHNVRMIYADCFPDNYASIRIMEKIGMTPFWNFGLFNTFRGWSYGEDRPALRHTISKSEWLAANDKNTFGTNDG